MAEPRLAEHTTLRLGGPARSWRRAEDESALVEEVRSADDAGDDVLLLGGGSNLVVGDEGFDGTVVEVATRGVQVETDSGGGAMVTVAAGESWEDLVARAVDSGWIGIEALAGIPGSVGATPVQNVGAYGQEVSQTIASVRCWDRRESAGRTLAAAECGFGYRTSRFKEDPGRYVVLAVTFQLPLGDLGAPVRYGELARTLGLAPGGRAPTDQVRAAVLGLRRAKGMVLDDADHDTWSAGSFFTNPFLSEDSGLLPEDAPRWPQSDGSVKTSAAWLIERAGFTRGYARGAVGLSTKHTLALTNRGGAATRELLALADEVRSGVRDRFGVALVVEPTLVGCESAPLRGSS